MSADGATPRPEPWKVVESATLVSDRWIHLRSDTAQDAAGRTISPYYVLEQADWITVLAVTADGEAVAVEEYHHGAGIVALGLVGGGVDAGEQPADAAARELIEETGYAAAEIIDLGAVWANWGNQTNRSHHFLARGCTRVAEQSLDGGELIDVRLMPLSELGEQLAQSYHLLTWHKAMAWLSTR